MFYVAHDGSCSEVINKWPGFGMSTWMITEKTDESGCLNKKDRTVKSARL